VLHKLKSNVEGNIFMSVANGPILALPTWGGDKAILLPLEEV
jgi:hypothetical protein